MKLIQNEDIYCFEYPFDETLLLDEYQRQKYREIPFPGRDGKPVENWRTVRKFRFPYVDYLEKVFNVKSFPKFYNLMPHTVLTPHIDRTAKCGINVLLADEEPAPVSVEGREYHYKICVLNTTKLHSVVNGPKNRLLFKMGIHDTSFEEVVKRVQKVTGQ